MSEVKSEPKDINEAMQILLKEEIKRLGIKKTDIANALGMNDSSLHSHLNINKILDLSVVRAICFYLGLSFVEFIEKAESLLAKNHVLNEHEEEEILKSHWAWLLLNVFDKQHTREELLDKMEPITEAELDKNIELLIKLKLIKETKNGSYAKSWEGTVITSISSTKGWKRYTKVLNSITELVIDKLLKIKDAGIHLGNPDLDPEKVKKFKEDLFFESRFLYLNRQQLQVILQHAEKFKKELNKIATEIEISENVNSKNSDFYVIEFSFCNIFKKVPGIKEFKKK